MPYARKRSSAGGATRAQVAAAIGARTASRFPYSKYGSAHYLRGSPGSLSKFGSSYRAASPYQQAVRKATGFVGRGKYSLPRFMNDFKLVESVGDRFLKKGIPNMLRAGGAVKSFMGRGLYGSQGGPMMTGGGAYTPNVMTNVADNALIVGGRQAPRTIATNDETDTIILTDCEFVKDVFAPSIADNTSSSFESETTSTNPGLAGFAPNLSQIACNYTEYEIQQLVFELRPVISENNVNDGQSGIAMMVFNYNPNEDPYDNKEDIMQAHGSVSGRIVQPIRCGVECDVRKTNKTKFFTRTGPVPYQKDADEYDMGVLTIATNNIPSTFSNKQIYELWVHYKVLLRKRKAGAMRLNNQQRDLFVCSGEISNAISDGLFSTQLIDGTSGILYSQQNNLHVGLTTPAAQKLTITFPASYSGFVEVRLIIEGTSLTNPSSTSLAPTFSASTGTTPVTTGNITTVADMYAGGASGDTVSYFSNGISSTKAFLIGHFKVKSASGGVDNAVTIIGGFLTGTHAISQWSLEVQELTQQHWQSRTQVAPILINLNDQTTKVTP